MSPQAKFLTLAVLTIAGWLLFIAFVLGVAEHDLLNPVSLFFLAMGVCVAAPTVWIINRQAPAA